MNECLMDDGNHEPAAEGHDLCTACEKAMSMVDRQEAMRLEELRQEALWQVRKAAREVVRLSRSLESDCARCRDSVEGGFHAAAPSVQTMNDLSLAVAKRAQLVEMAMMLGCDSEAVNEASKGEGR